MPSHPNRIKSPLVAAGLRPRGAGIERLVRAPAGGEPTSVPKYPNINLLNLDCSLTAALLDLPAVLSLHKRLFYQLPVRLDYHFNTGLHSDRHEVMEPGARLRF